jgi:hypothetical protein
MGYRSEVGAAIVCETKDDLDKIIAQLPAGDWDKIKELVDVIEGGRKLTFHIDGWKWYSTRILGFQETGYDDVNNIELLLQTAQNLNTDNELDEAEGVRSVGVFVRIGEEDNDNESWSWGEEDADKGLPYPWDLAHISTTIETDW